MIGLMLEDMISDTQYEPIDYLRFRFTTAKLFLFQLSAGWTIRKRMHKGLDVVSLLNSPTYIGELASTRMLYARIDLTPKLALVVEN